MFYVSSIFQWKNHQSFPTRDSVDTYSAVLELPSLYAVRISDNELLIKKNITKMLFEGDVFGPVFPSSPITTESLLSRSLRGTEANLFNFATTMWSLHYLRLTNQLESDVLYSGLNDMNVQMADLMRMYNQDGSFSSHKSSHPSVWVTVCEI